MNVPTRWIVTEGAYSDMSVVAVFDTERDAEQAVAAGFGDDYEEVSAFAAGQAPVMDRTVTLYVALHPQSGARLYDYERNQAKGRHPAAPAPVPTKVKAEITYQPRGRFSFGSGVYSGPRVQVQVSGPDDPATREAFDKAIARALVRIEAGAAEYLKGGRFHE